jgi:hypothetical protein
MGCTSTVPGVNDPFIDDPLPPKPTASPSEVRRIPVNRVPSAATAKKSAPVASQNSSPYKIVNDAGESTSSATHKSSSTVETTGTRTKKSSNQSVLRRASAEQDMNEPAQFQADRSIRPIIRSQTPDEVVDYAIPHNPLRR